MSNATASDGSHSEGWMNPLLALRFLVVHLLCFAAIWTGISWTAIVMFVVLYAVRMFAITGGYHRYFSHRTYKMGRVMQFIMAVLAESSAQKGVLWWASHHRHHHTHSDDPDDVHSPKQHGFWYAHLGWLFDPDWADTDDERIKDLARYPELVWLDRYHMLPPTILGVSTWLIGGWSGLIVGFFWSTVALWHATFTINSLAHVIGNRRYETDDESKNNWFLALITFGEGWHNNHHHYQAAVNQGFRWYEFDITYYILKAMSWVGLVSDLRTAPEHVVEDKPHPRKQRALARKKRAEQEAKAEKAPQQAGDEASRWLDDLEEAAMCRYVELRDSAVKHYEELRDSAREAQASASKRLDEISEAAHLRYVEMGESASRTAEEIKMSAREAKEEAARQVDEFARSLVPQPDPEMG